MERLRSAPRLLPLFLSAPFLAGCASVSPGTAEVRVSDVERTFDFVYSAATADVPGHAKSVRLWIPLPRTTLEQDVAGLRVTGLVGNAAFELGDAELSVPGTAELAGLRWTVGALENGEGHSLCLETGGAPIELELRCRVTRRESAGVIATDADAARHLEPDTLIPLDGKVATIAASLPRGESRLETARELYEHTLERMRYDKPAGGEWGRGDAEWACESRHGNCTDFHSYFMGLARAKEIPARFVMGFPVPAGSEREAAIGGYHCWAYFLVEDQWIPVDISEADKNPELAEFFFGNLDANRVELTSGRDVLLSPRPAGGALNYFVYPYAEIDGAAWERVRRSFRRILVDG